MGIRTSIIWLDTVDSTNNEARRHISTLANLSVLSASFQTAGKGQRGNSWKSASGENLMFSIVLKFSDGVLPPVTAKDQFIISELTTVAVHDYLLSEGVVSRIKWPNDIYVGRKKICGILIENSLSEEELAYSIAGVGLNMNQTAFPPELVNPSSMALLTGKKYDLHRSLEDLMEHFSNTVSLLLSENGKSLLHSRYLDLLYQKDEVHHYVDCTTGKSFQGTIKGISDKALLQVEMPGGSLKEFAFKEINYII
jgi:BirA family biotin operon repressor/biotin-[acetyl-CoA-carboxylase] ligase